MRTGTECGRVLRMREWPCSASRVMRKRASVFYKRASPACAKVSWDDCGRFRGRNAKIKKQGWLMHVPDVLLSEAHLKQLHNP